MVLDRNPLLREFEADPSAFLPRRYRPEDIEFLTLTSIPPELAPQIRNMAHDSFQDDRFHWDHQCPAEIADRRFVFWMEDLMADPGVKFDLLYLRGEPIAFFARKGNHQIVSGFARERANSGLGEFFWLSTNRAVKNEGHKSVHSLVSANNLPSLNLCARCGYRFKDTGYTFHYWVNPPG
jgi:RimJ/RimL family protein N-acetyltransferase